jgi:hypothetical protein
MHTSLRGILGELKTILSRSCRDPMDPISRTCPLTGLMKAGRGDQQLPSELLLKITYSDFNQILY